MILALDVHYRTDTTKSVCIAFHDWADEMPLRVHAIFIGDVAQYEPGAFYKRELPCLLAVLRDFDLGEVSAIVIDGYVVLDDNGKPGLGTYLYDALDRKIPVIGVAKTRFFSNTQLVAEIKRGESNNPLFVTSTGMPLTEAADHITAMAGPYRIPTLLKLLDTETKQ
jgi:deoxyribonuclease V